MLTVETPEELALYVGKPLGTSDWVLVNQQMIDAFAEATGDRNWYHIDVERAKREMPDISMATVYNCLDALVKCGTVRQVSLERGAARFCPNMQEHCHFYCDACEGVFDIDLPARAGVTLPKGFNAERYDVAIHGRCPACSNGGKPAKKNTRN